MKNYDIEKIVLAIVNYCYKNKIKYIFISGNGASGKTELSKMIKKASTTYGYVNTIDMDEFVVDTRLRKNAKIEWINVHTGNKEIGTYSTVFPASYFLQNINAILYNLKKGNNYWHWPKRAKSEEECIEEFRSDAFLTIVEGVGSVYLARSAGESLSIFIRCSKDIEIERRIKRGKFSNEQSRSDVEKQYEDRNKQFESIILPFAEKHDLQFESCEDYSCNIVVDKLGVFDV